VAKKPRKKEEDINSYRHEAETRENAVPVGLISYDTLKLKPKENEYDPHLDPQLVCAGKKEHTSFEFPTVSLNMNERITPEAIIRSIKRENTQQDLFATLYIDWKKLLQWAIPYYFRGVER
jgi:adenine-specific DNA-methyltransferase